MLFAQVLEHSHVQFKELKGIKSLSGKKLRCKNEVSSLPPHQRLEAYLDGVPSVYSTRLPQN
jgi:hypothetical protein